MELVRDDTVSVQQTTKKNFLGDIEFLPCLDNLLDIEFTNIADRLCRLMDFNERKWEPWRQFPRAIFRNLAENLCGVILWRAYINPEEFIRKWMQAGKINIPVYIKMVMFLNS